MHRDRLKKKRRCSICKSWYHPFKSYKIRWKSKTCSRRCHNTRIARESAAARGDKMRITDQALSKRQKGLHYPNYGGKPAHRTFAERMLGRKLKKGEVVHHRNRNTCDFHHKNLLVYDSQSKHMTDGHGSRVCKLWRCGRKHYGKGWCSLHYRRVRLHGTPYLTGEKPHSCMWEGCKTKPGVDGYCDEHRKEKDELPF